MKKNDTIEKLDKVVEYIEQNINYEINLDDIAACSGLSKFYLHKIFKATTDEKLMAYVRNRKLSHSINDLIRTDLRIIDIAQNYSFEYEQSYIRSFINTFGLSPDRFRKEKPTVKIVDKINWDHLTPIDEKNIIYRPVTVIKSSFHVAGIKHLVKLDENFNNCFTTEAGNDFFCNHLHKINNIKKPCSYIGLIFNGLTNNYMYYITGTEVFSRQGIPSDMVFYNIPSYRYNVFKYIGFHSPHETTVKHLNKIYSYIYVDWFKMSTHLFDKDFHFEYINMEHPRDDYCELDIYIPLSKI